MTMILHNGTKAIHLTRSTLLLLFIRRPLRRSDYLTRFSSSTSTSTSTTTSVKGTIPWGGRGVEEGQSSHVERTFTSNDIQTFGILVGDLNPLHHLSFRKKKKNNNDNKHGQDDDQQKEGGGGKEDETDSWEHHPLFIQQQSQKQQQFMNDDKNQQQQQQEESNQTKEIVHGMLVASLFSCIFGTLAPGAVYLKQTLQFVKPVYVGTPVVATTTIVRVRDWKRRRGGVVVTCQTKVHSPSPPSWSLSSPTTTNSCKSSSTTTTTTTGDNNNNNNGPVDGHQPVQQQQVVEDYVVGEADVWLHQGYPI